MGCSVAQKTDRLLVHAKELEALVDGEMANRLLDAVQLLQNKVYKIAIIGQVKAGKSSLINAIVQQPGLLPTDVNPWTAVVTKLHFKEGNERQAGMVFSFFDTKEWNDLFVDGGPMSTLMSRLGSTSNRTELVAQLANARDHAEGRLGRSFHHLLGKRHKFERVSAEVLMRYVCASQLKVLSARDEGPGRFADITKAADLYCDAGPFACPVTVIDTPGTNDPFLLRDEATQEELAKADVAILVLNVQQALSAADLDLLRRLQGMHAYRIVVFINRADVLKDIVVDSRKVRSKVARKLKSVFPKAKIPIIIGSAQWGTLAQQPKRQDVAVSSSLASLASHLEILSPEELKALRAGRQLPWSRMQEIFRLCSGLPALSAQISAMMAAGAGRYALSHAGEELSAIVRSAEAENNNERQALSMLSDMVESVPGADQQSLGEIEASFARLRDLADVLKTMSKAFEHDMALMMKMSLQRMQTDLEATVTTFAAETGSSLKTAAGKTTGRKTTAGKGAERSSRRLWRCDLSPLRLLLAERFLRGYARLAEGLIEVQQSALDDLEGQLREAAPDHAIDMGYHPPHHVDPSPSIAALGRVVALDLGRPWLDWWKRWRHDDDNATALAQLVTSELQPVVKQLVDSARREIERYADQATGRFAVDIKATIETLENRHKRAALIYKELLQKRQSWSQRQVSADYRQQLAMRSRRAENLSAAMQGLQATRQLIEKGAAP